MAKKVGKVGGAKKSGGARRSSAARRSSFAKKTDHAKTTHKTKETKKAKDTKTDTKDKVNISDEAKEGEPFVKLGGEEVFLRQGDVVVRDAKGIVCTFFHGQSERAKVRRDTKNALLIGFYAPGISDAQVRRALGDAGNFAKFACRAKPGFVEFHGRLVKMKPVKGLVQKKKAEEKKESEKIDPWKVQEVRDYGKIMREFGIKPFRSVLKNIPEPHLYMRRGIIFGQRDFGVIAERMKKKQPFIMLTGLMPSGKFHIGHKMVADEFIYLQSKGAKTYICVADIEAYNMRGQTLEELRKTAIEEYLLNYIALGLKPKNCEFYFQSSRSRDPEKANAYYRLIGLASRRVTMNEMKAIYGNLSPGKIMSIMTQVADILHPQLPEFEGKMPTVVPVGVDQDPHIKLTRDIASRLNKTGHFHFAPPSSMYHEFMKGLGGGKMSSSDPNSFIALTDSPGAAARKIRKYAFSGGAPTVEEHRKHGGNPDIDVSFNMLRFMFEPDDSKLKRIEEDYRSGALLTGELKEIVIEKLKRFLVEHRKKRELARKQVPKFLKN